MEIIFKKALKSKLIFLAIFLCIPSYTKEYKDLFNVYYPIDSTSNIQKTLNESFNVMVFRLSGSSSPSNIWKIINAGNPREKYILSYTSKRIDNKSYLVTNFNQELFMQTFLELDIPLVGYSRPSILLLINKHLYAEGAPASLLIAFLGLFSPYNFSTQGAPASSVLLYCMSLCYDL